MAKPRASYARIPKTTDPITGQASVLPDAPPDVAAARVAAKAKATAPALRSLVHQLLEEAGHPDAQSERTRIEVAKSTGSDAAYALAAHDALELLRLDPADFAAQVASKGYSPVLLERAKRARERLPVIDLLREAYAEDNAGPSDVTLATTTLRSAAGGELDFEVCIGDGGEAYDARSPYDLEKGKGLDGSDYVHIEG